jgi:hypothetical protein
MWILFNPPAASDEVQRVRHAMVEALKHSRFVIPSRDIEVCAPGTNRVGGSRRWTIKLSNIRLRLAKDYCGQHPGPCQVIPGFNRPHARRRHLEGADFVGFNDGLNTVFDRLAVSADIFSHNIAARCSRFYIRKGRCRRVRYTMSADDRGFRVFYFWDAGEDNDFVDYCGRKHAPRSEYPTGTPGLAQWRENVAKPKSPAARTPAVL